MEQAVENTYYSVNIFDYTLDNVVTDEELYMSLENAVDFMNIKMLDIIKNDFPSVFINKLINDSETFTFSIDKFEISKTASLIIEKYDNSIDIYTKTKSYFNFEKTQKLFKIFISKHVIDTVSPAKLKFLTNNF